MSRDMRTVLNDGEQVCCWSPSTRGVVAATFKKLGYGVILLTTPDGQKVFSSASAFATFVMGKPVNGWTNVFVKRGGYDIWLQGLPVAPAVPVTTPAVTVAPVVPAVPVAEATDARVAALEAKNAALTAALLASADALKETIAALRAALRAIA